MGWLSNTNNAERQINITALESLQAHVVAKGQLLERVRNETSEAISKLQLLTLAGVLKAPAITNNASELGRALGSALTELQTHAGELHSLHTETLEEAAISDAMIENYSVPRGRRPINASGKDMAQVASAKVRMIQGELSSINGDHTHIMQKANQTIADVTRHLNS